MIGVRTVTLLGERCYRYFYQDYEDDGFVWVMAAHGFHLGLGIGF